MSTVYVVRPGETEFDEQARIQGDLDLPMSERGRQQVTDQAQEPRIVDLLSQDRQEHGRIQAIKAAGDIPLDEPDGSLPSLDRGQGRVTAPIGPKAVGEPAKLRLIVRLQDGAHHLLQQLVRPRRES